MINLSAFHRVQATAPTVKQVSVERLRLLQLLPQVQERRLTLIQSPPGYGKTSLMLEWHRLLQSTLVNSAWVTLAGTERTASAFYALIHMACDHRPSPQQHTDVDDTGTSLDTATAALVDLVSQQKAPFALFLDNYDCAQSNDTDQMVRTLLRLLPDGMHIIIAARSKPNVELEDLRLHNELLEVTEQELRFDFHEAQALAQSMGRRIDGAALTDLVEATEGWAPALAVAIGASARKSSDADMVATALDYTPEISQYFMEQVLSKTPDHIRQFLCVTALPAYFDGDLANALLEIDDGWQLTETVHRQNLFIRTTQNLSERFHYHPLFRHFLVERLKREHPKALETFHRRAMAWFRDAGDNKNALRHAVLVKDHAFVAELLCQLGGWRLVLEGHLDFLQLGLPALSEQIIRERPALALGEVFRLIKNGAIPAASQYFKSLDITDSDTWTPQALAEMRVLENTLNSYADIPITLREIKELEHLRNDVPQNDNLVHALLIGPTAAGYYELGMLEPAFKACELQMSYYRQLKSLYGEVFTRFLRCNIWLAQGNLRASERLLLQTFEECSHHPELKNSLQAHAGIYLSLTLYELDRLDEVAELQRLYMPQIEHIDGWFDIYMTAYEVAAAMTWREKGIDGILDLLGDIDHIKDSQGIGRLAVFAEILKAHYLVLAGSFSGASGCQHILETFVTENESTEMALGILQIRAVATLAEIYLALAQPARAIALLERYSVLLEGSGHIRRLIKVRMTLTKALMAEGDPEGAVRHLDLAIREGMFCGFKRLYIDSATGLLPVIKLALASSGLIAEDRYRDTFLKELRRSLLREEKEAAAKNQFLSNGEKDVLEELNRGYSNKEIGRILGISPNTVKYRLKNLYLKFNVQSRGELVRVYRAQQPADGQPQ